MSTVSSKSWDRYLKALRKISEKATEEMKAKIEKTGTDSKEKLEELVRYAYALATKYGETAAVLAAEMYDALAILSGKIVAPAVPAATATFGDAARAVYGTNLISSDPEVMAASVGRLTKMAGADTMLKNAIRDGAQYAWIPRGDTCAFCLQLASYGWQDASRKALKGDHAEHIHANCDCTYAIRFSDDLEVEGYDYKEYEQMFKDAEGPTVKEKRNALRRKFYAENSEEIREQQRSAYAKRKELNSSQAEEINVGD